MAALMWMACQATSAKNTIFRIWGLEQGLQNISAYFYGAYVLYGNAAFEVVTFPLERNHGRVRMTGCFGGSPTETSILARGNPLPFPHIQIINPSQQS